MLKGAFKVMVCGVLIIQLTGCGTIFYPERKGQKDGRLDIGIVLLDGIGLLFFLIPGIIAYAVDFSNGTIYLPGGTLSSGPDGIREVKFNPKTTSKKELEAIIKKETGKDVSFDQKDLEVSELKSIDELKIRVAAAQAEIGSPQLSLLNR